MSTVAVVGAGAWGTALAAHAAKMGHTVRIWAHEPHVSEEMRAHHVNTVYLPDVPLPESLEATSDAEEALSGADIVLLVAPSKFLRSVCAQVAAAVPKESLVVIATKGIEEGSLKLMSDVVQETLPDVPEERRLVMSGPSFAKEVATGLPTDVTVACASRSSVEAVQKAFHSPMFRVYGSDDPIGVQVGGAVKNVIAVATGAGDGLGFGNNARAAIITRGLAEIARLGVAMGADPLTFIGLAGVGDLFLTCSGELSRNRTLGKKIAQGLDAQEYLASQPTVAEGYFTAAATHELAEKLGVEMPIAEQVYYVLHRERPLAEAVRILVSRNYKDELEGIRAAFQR